MRGRFVWTLVATIASCGAVDAQSPCDQFSWPVRREVGWLSSANLPMVSSGGELAGDGPFVLSLQPMASVAFKIAPERAPKTAESFGGTVAILAPSQAGTYHITLNDEAWIDLVQNGHRVASTAFTGKTGCTGVRKSVRFEIEQGPLVIQISGAASGRIAIAAAHAM
jgi:hypothetical protein